MMLHDMRNELVNMVRNTEWSYAIFWTGSSSESGVIMEWGEGYYNNGESYNNNNNNNNNNKGKTSEKCTEDETYKRSEQLRKLYETLLKGKVSCEQQGRKRRSTSLCMDELSHLEWYYLLCMSFTFNFGQSLPGRVYATGEHIWLCEAQTADSEAFSRSLLAKSASVQTVICFPYMGGVVELGSTELISEDMELIERLLKTSQQTVKPTTPCSTDYNSSFAADLLPSSKFTADQIFDDETDIVVNQSVEQDLNITSLDDCSIGSASPSHDFSIQLLKGATTSYDSRKNLNLGGVRNVSAAFPDTETGADIHYNIRTDQMIDFQSRYPPNYLLQPCEPCDLNVVHFRTDNVPSYAFQEERECEKFMILRSMVPSLTKLQSDEQSIHSVVSHDTLEVKNSEVDDFGMDLERSTPTDGLEKATETDIMQFIDVEMSALNNDVQVELSCSWREHLLLNVMKALHNLDLDTHTVQSSTYGGAFFLSLKAKFRGAAFASEDMIKQALMRVINKN